MTEILQASGGLLAAVAAILAWAAKLRWSSEFKAAKDETIAAKEAHIKRLESEVDMLRHQDPIKLREHYLSIKGQHEELITDLQKDIQQTREELRRAQAAGESQAVVEAKVIENIQVRWLERFTQALTSTDAEPREKLVFMVEVHPSVAALQLEVHTISSDPAIIVFSYLGIRTQVTTEARPADERGVVEHLIAAVQRRIVGQLQFVESDVFRSHLKRQVAVRHRHVENAERAEPERAAQDALATRHFESAWLEVYEAAVNGWRWPTRLAKELYTEAIAAQHRGSWQRLVHRGELEGAGDDPLRLSSWATHFG